MKNRNLNIVKTITTSLAEKKMLQDVINNIKDVPAFQDKKDAIRSCIDTEKSKQGELTVSFV